MLVKGVWPSSLCNTQASALHPLQFHSNILSSIASLSLFDPRSTHFIYTSFMHIVFNCEEESGRVCLYKSFMVQFMPVLPMRAGWVSPTAIKLPLVTWGSFWRMLPRWAFAEDFGSVVDVGPFTTRIHLPKPFGFAACKHYIIHVYTRIYTYIHIYTYIAVKVLPAKSFAALQTTKHQPFLMIDDYGSAVTKRWTHRLQRSAGHFM